MSTAAPAKNIPDTIRRFSGSAMNVTLKRWPDRDGERGQCFLELSQSSGKTDGNGKTIWHQVSVNLSDVAGLLETIQRAKTLGIQTEDTR